MAKYVVQPNEWVTIIEPRGSIQNVSNVPIEISAESKPNTGIRLSEGDIISFSGSVYARSCGNDVGVLTTVPFSAGGGGGDDSGTDPEDSGVEREIGIWVDGRKLYQKTIVTQSPNKINEIQLVSDTSTMNINAVVDYSGVVQGTEGVSYNLKTNYSDRGRLAIETWYVNDVGFKMIVNDEALLQKPTYITCKYTKKST